MATKLDLQQQQLDMMTRKILQMFMEGKNEHDIQSPIICISAAIGAAVHGLGVVKSCKPTPVECGDVVGRTIEFIVGELEKLKKANTYTNKTDADEPAAPNWDEDAAECGHDLEQAMRCGRQASDLHVELVKLVEAKRKDGQLQHSHTAIGAMLGSAAELMGRYVVKPPRKVGMVGAVVGPLYSEMLKLVEKHGKIDKEAR